jgi:hypothetical protein
MQTQPEHRTSKTLDSEEAQSPVKNMSPLWLKARRVSWPDALILLLLYPILLFGLAQQQLHPDTEKYQCYAFAFWHGISALPALPTGQCTFITHPADTTAAKTHTAFLEYIKHSALPTQVVMAIEGQSMSQQAYHLLPYEYPLLALLSFSPGLLGPSGWYRETFALWMFCITVGLYVLLLHRRSRGAALAFALYLAIGCFGTALGRFDLLPTACTFGALLCAERAKWRYAFLLLAIATMLKFYPVVLLVPLLITQWTWAPLSSSPPLVATRGRGRWIEVVGRRYISLAIFISICSMITVLSLAVSVEGTLAPLIYFGMRPLQIESTSASVVWLLSTIGGYPLTYAFSFGSRNVLSLFSGAVLQGGGLLFVAGLCFVYWLQWREKITLSLTFLLTLLLVVVTGKVFSAQYLIWLAPFVAYAGGWERRWLLSWGGVSLITTLIYPFLYNRGQYPFGTLLPEMYATICIRNVLLLLFTCSVLFLAARNHFRTDVR